MGWPPSLTSVWKNSLHTLQLYLIFNGQSRRAKKAFLNTSEGEFFVCFWAPSGWHGPATAPSFCHHRHRNHRQAVQASPEALLFSSRVQPLSLRCIAQLGAYVQLAVWKRKLEAGQGDYVLKPLSDGISFAPENDSRSIEQKYLEYLVAFWKRTHCHTFQKWYLLTTRWWN